MATTWRRSFPLPTDKPSRRPAPEPKRPKQLYEVLTKAEVDAMSPADRANRLVLCEHQLANKEKALQLFAQNSIKPKDYMYAEVDGLRLNIFVLKS